MVPCPSGPGSILPPPPPALKKSEKEGEIPAFYSNIFNCHIQASHYPTDLSMKIVGLSLWLKGREPAWYAWGCCFDPSSEEKEKKRKR